MSTGTPRTTALNPSHFIDLVEHLVNNNMIRNEVCVRRMISALYFCLFNYWVAKRYEIDGVRGKGPRQDYFYFRLFHEYLLKRKLDKELILLYTLRTAVDHYMLNPTIIEVQNKELRRIISKRRIEVSISIEKLKKAIMFSRRILEHI